MRYIPPKHRASTHLSEKEIPPGYKVTDNSLDDWKSTQSDCQWSQPFNGFIDAKYPFQQQPNKAATFQMGNREQKHVWTIHT